MRTHLHNLLAEIIADNLSAYFTRRELAEIHTGSGGLKAEEIEAVQKIVNIGTRLTLRLEEDNPSKFNLKVFREKSRIDEALDIAIQKVPVKTGG